MFKTQRKWYNKLRIYIPYKTFAVNIYRWDIYRYLSKLFKQTPSIFQRYHINLHPPKKKSVNLFYTFLSRVHRPLVLHEWVWSVSIIQTIFIDPIMSTVHKITKLTLKILHKIYCNIFNVCLTILWLNY